MMVLVHGHNKLIEHFYWLKLLSERGDGIGYNIGKIDFDNWVMTITLVVIVAKI